MKDYELGWADRTIRTQEFGWNSDGTPNFPRYVVFPYPMLLGNHFDDVLGQGMDPIRFQAGSDDPELVSILGHRLTYTGKNIPMMQVVR